MSDDECWLLVVYDDEKPLNKGRLPGGEEGLYITSPL